jgi:hypothetical protein
VINGNQIQLFHSDTENGIETQICCKRIAHLMLNVIRRQSKAKKALNCQRKSLTERENNVVDHGTENG